MVVGDDNVSDYSAFDYLAGYDYNRGGSVIDGRYVWQDHCSSLDCPIEHCLSWIKAKILDIGVDMGFFNKSVDTWF